MKLSEYQQLDLCLYKIYWKSGGSSLASIGMTENGNRWIAPTNWVSPSTDQDICEQIESVTKIQCN